MQGSADQTPPNVSCMMHEALVLYDCETLCITPSPNILRVIKSRMRWVGM